jgi:basic membrane protein A
VTSAIQRVPVLLLNVATLVRRGRWEGKQYTFGMKEGALDIAPFYGLLTKDEEQRVRQIQQDIVTTKIDVFR